MNSGGYKWYSEEEVASWPENHKRCRGCDAILHFSEFHRQKQTLFGLNNYCKTCRHPKSVKHYSEKSLEKLMLERAKSRANRKGVPFNLSEDDIVIPERCPVLGIDLFHSDAGVCDNTPSLDRLVPEKGYVAGNVVVISNRANRIKSNATAEEIFAVADWLDSGAF